MGSSLSALQVQHRNELQYLLRKAQHDCPARALTLLLQEVRAKCPWYPEAGSLKLADWERLGQTLHKEPRASVQALHAWHLCRDVVQRVASDRPSLARLPIPPPPSAPAAIPPPGDATQRVASERPSPAPTEGLPIPPPPFAPAAIPPPALPPVPLLPLPPWPSPPEPVCDHPPPWGPPGGSSASAQKLSLVQQMVHAAKARSDLTAEELADLVSVCPVTWQNDDQGNPVGTWTTLSYSVVREVRKAIREFGLTSTFVRGLVEGMGTGYSLIPEDWKTLLRMMLSPSQYVIWLRPLWVPARCVRPALKQHGMAPGTVESHTGVQLTLEETALPPESTTTGRKRRRRSVPSQPVTWGAVKALVATAQRRLAADQQPETPETLFVAILAQITANSVMIVCLLSACYFLKEV
nr:endogenous retrovirus group K member 21 Gag polyprotein-like isoform X1 [Caretta caretta]